jgi:hypothetical protein
MKIILMSSLLAVLVISSVSSTKTTFKSSDIDIILNESEKNITKANSVAKIADIQQKEEMVVIRTKMNKLIKEKNQLQKALIKIQNELQIVKDTISNYPLK